MEDENRQRKGGGGSKMKKKRWNNECVGGEGKRIEGKTKIMEVYE